MSGVSRLLEAVCPALSLLEITVPRYFPSVLGIFRGPLQVDAPSSSAPLPAGWPGGLHPWTPCPVGSSPLGGRGASWGLEEGEGTGQGTAPIPLCLAWVS